MKTGRPAKPAHQRVNRHQPTHETVTLPAEGRPGRAPRPLGGAFTGEAAKLWRTLWSTPEATQWGEADVPGLTRLVVLNCNRENWADPKILGEMRNLEDRYGCNVYARRVNKLVRGEPDQEATTDAHGNPVRRLHSVDRSAVAGA